MVTYILHDLYGRQDELISDTDWNEIYCRTAKVEFFASLRFNELGVKQQGNSGCNGEWFRVAIKVLPPAGDRQAPTYDPHHTTMMTWTI